MEKKKMLLGVAALLLVGALLFSNIPPEDSQGRVRSSTRISKNKISSPAPALKSSVKSDSRTSKVKKTTNEAPSTSMSANNQNDGTGDGLITVERDNAYYHGSQFGINPNDPNGTQNPRSLNHPSISDLIGLNCPTTDRLQLGSWKINTSRTARFDKFPINVGQLNNSVAKDFELSIGTSSGGRNVLNKASVQKAGTLLNLSSPVTLQDNVDYYVTLTGKFTGNPVAGVTSDNIRETGSTLGVQQYNDHGDFLNSGQAYGDIEMSSYDYGNSALNARYSIGYVWRNDASCN